MTWVVIITYLWRSVQVVDQSDLRQRYEGTNIYAEGLENPLGQSGVIYFRCFMWLKIVKYGVSVRPNQF